MVSFRIGFRENTRSGGDYPNISINGKVDKRSFVFDHEKERIYAHLYSPVVAQPLLAAQVSEIEKRFEHLQLPCRVDWSDYFDSIGFDFRSHETKPFPSIEIELQPDFERWAKPYSLVEYAEAIERVIKARKKSHQEFFQSDELISNGFGLRCRIESLESTVKAEIDRCLQAFREICDEAEKILLTSARKNSITTFFNFPPEVRVACGQYLLYFSQFLEDLGIKADAEIKEDAQRVLFSVTPADGASALKQVREALEAYLQLPKMKQLTGDIQSTEIAVQQLQANVLHLRSQLTLANAALMAKDATIEALQVSNFQYRQLLSSDKTANREQEKLIGDIVYVTPVETKGIKVDLPSLLRRLKRRFGLEATRLLPPTTDQ
jgi:hypothetical protein